MKNILCFEGEWKFNTHKKPERLASLFLEC